MAKAIMMDQLHVTIFAAASLSRPEYRTIRRTLNGPRFDTDLRRAIRSVFGRYPSLSKVRITLTH